MRFGLFHQLFWPVVAVLAAVVSAVVLFSAHFFDTTAREAWNADLQQEAEWTARHFRFTGPTEGLPPGAHPGGHDGKGPSTPGELGAAWRAMHDSVRLTIFDAGGRVVVDSRPEAPPPKLGPRGSRLMGRAPVAMPRGGVGTLVLSRRHAPDFGLHFHRQGWAWMLLIFAMAAAAVYPVVRRLTRDFGRLSALARRVADGGSGATLEVKGRSEFSDLVEAFNHMSVRLQDEELRRRRLIADVSHELRSPLARMRALAETIARRPKEAAQHLARIGAEIALMDRLVGDMLDAARLEAGSAEVSCRSIRLADWAEDAFERFRRRAEADGVACAVSVDAGAAEVELDPERMLQAVGNLVENALAAVRGVAAGHIALACRADSAGVEITVTDNGPGIPEADLPFVFDRFFRVERDRGRRSGGVGLGLGIAKAIVEAHHGRLTLSPGVEGGICARIALPVP